MNITEKSWSASEIAAATEVPPATLQNWLKRGVIVGHRVEGGGTQGKHRSFSFFNMMEIAIAKSLLDIGVKNVELAFMSAARFSHVSSGGSGWTGCPDKVVVQRLPSFPHHHNLGNTFLFVSGDKSLVKLAQGDISLPKIRRELGGPAGFITLDATEIFSRVMQNLSLDYRVVLDQVYPQEAT